MKAPTIITASRQWEIEILLYWISGSDIDSWTRFCFDYFFYAASIYYRAIFTILRRHICVGDGWLGLCEWQKEKKSCWQLRKLSLQKHALPWLRSWTVSIDHWSLSLLFDAKPMVSCRFLKPGSCYFLFLLVRCKS
jgi:hypothetical protein